MATNDPSMSKAVERDVFTLPQTLTIMSPKRISLPRGQSAGKQSDTPFSVRYDPEELASIRAAAAALDMTVASFLRWVGYFASQEVIRQNKLWLEELRKAKRGPAI
jgi:hypothetical protein